MTKLKSIMIITMFLLAGCSLISEGSGSTSSSSTSNSSKLKTCSIEEATKKIKDGSAFSKSLQDNADEISNICIKKLALEAAGLDSQATESAKSSLQKMIDTADYLKK